MSTTDSSGTAPVEIAAADTPTPVDWEDEIERALHAQNDDESHVEQDPRVWHPSQLSRCKRQAVLSSYGLTDHDTDTLGVFKTGTLIHEWLEDTFDGRLPGVEHEYEVSAEYDVGGDTIRITGHADVWDAHAGVVYDWKTRGGWYNFDPPREDHLDQITLYMDAVGAEAGQIVYVSRKDLELRPWPESGTFAFDPARHSALLQKAAELRDAIQTHGKPTCVEDVPFPKCGCYPCSQE